MKYYLYIHTRLDRNEVFYVGIGTCTKFTTHRMKYKRAYTSHRRSVLWKNIVNKGGYKVDILLESDDQAFIKSEEIRYIKLYGRKDLKEGTLVNNTDGGDGRLTPNKESMINVGHNLKLYTDSKKKKVYQYDLEGNFIREWDCLSDAARELGQKSNSGIVQACRERTRYFHNYIWRYEKLEKALMRSKKSTGEKKVGMYDKNTLQLIQIFNSLSEAQKLTNISFKAISLCALGKSKSSGGFVWKYI